MYVFKRLAKCRLVVFFGDYARLGLQLAPPPIFLLSHLHLGLRKISKNDNTDSNSKTATAKHRQQKWKRKTNSLFSIYMKQPFTLLAQAILMTLLIKKRKKDLEIRVTAQIYQLTMARLPKNAPSQTIYEMQL